MGMKKRSLWLVISAGLVTFFGIGLLEYNRSENFWAHDELITKMPAQKFATAAAITNKADLVAFSYDRPLQLYALLESIQKYVSGIEQSYVIVRASDDAFRKAYYEVQTSFPDVQFIYQGVNPCADFKPLTMHAAFDSPSAYVIFAVDDIIVKDYVNLTDCIALLEKTGAYGFYLQLGKNLSYCYTLNTAQPLPALQQVKDDVYTWQFRQGHCDWCYPHTVDMTLYRKKDIVSDLRTLNFYSPNTMEAIWSGRVWGVAQRSGLCYALSKIVNLPLNRVQSDCINRHMDFLTAKEMLELFYKGLKIDSAPLFKMANNDVHTEYMPTFIKR